MTRLFNPNPVRVLVAWAFLTKLSAFPGPAGQPPDPQSHAGGQQGVLPEDEGGLLPLPGRGGHRGGEGW